ncbi:CBS domain-containing protein [Erythrobacter sp. HL-111]|uniref:CBS domain-containing protein n=1 Tax=Erythrobacter sp. HL-111 TaxID=1798193 RepID=UPI0006D9B35D|nr:CBS domain-containing protein [Erythrobacter sp. HL-111]KPP91154.1 MAG: CBS domain protein [Erythrobacteraceae bacterium HL-111]SDS45500.1 CBS domain-containing protein [Erythrobacter sp. HL-111]
MQVSEIMATNVKLVSPDTSVKEAARQMRNADTGALPVGEDDRLVGMVTDRDIAIRAVAAGQFDASVRDVLSEDVCYCFEDDETERAAQIMGENQVRRLPVMNRDKRLVGIVSLGDISRSAGDSAGVALSDISRQNEAPRDM